MSSTQSATNGEQMRDNLTAHEEEAQTNSDFTNPQMPHAQTILDQYKIRKQRNQVLKAHNMLKHESSKEKQRWLKEELPDNFNEMRSAVHAHCVLLLKVKDKDFSSLPDPPSTEEGEFQFRFLVICVVSPKMFSMSHKHKFSLRASKATVKMSFKGWD
ncbi:hypothetical protein O181_008442 [Austropuccinia psidii MF-1]|uniref:Uncharacterized protein n=1 Tax=Austropuccinia psidii MF-1 TaxID=1389203 RepID=A0A9Q3BNT3_9BASI|nr:hypothetical protein [Austropuccinia psidii MF-1]